MLFNSIPATRVPGQYAEFAPITKSGLSLLRYTALAIGQGTDAGTATANQINLIPNAAKAAALYGPGSQIHRMAISFFANNAITPLYAIAPTMDALATPANKSTGTLTIGHVATAAGNIYLYIDGRRIVVPVATTDTVNNIASNVSAAVNLVTELPVVATVNNAVVTLTAKNIGVTGNSIDVRLNRNEGEALPTACTCTIVAMASGAADPALTTAITALGDIWYQGIISPYMDSTNRAALITEMERRFGPTKQIDGVLFSASSGTSATLASLGAGINSKQLCLVGIYDFMETACEVAAAVAGQVLGQLAAGNGAESLPFTGLQLVGIHAPTRPLRFTFSEKDTLLNSGVSTLKIDDSDVVRIERLITTYRTDDGGSADTTWLDINARFTAMYLRYDWVNYIGSKYQRAKLMSDASRVGPGQKVMDIKTGKAEAISRFAVWERNALVQDPDGFKAALIAELDGSDLNAFDWMLPCKLVKQFLVGKSQIGILA